MWAGRQEVGRRPRTRRGMHGESATEGWGVRTRTKRTLNIESIFVTLETSKLSGWLKALAYCRVEKRAYEAGRDVGQRREGEGRRWRKRRARGGLI